MPESVKQEDAWNYINIQNTNNEEQQKPMEIPTENITHKQRIQKRPKLNTEPKNNTTKLHATKIWERIYGTNNRKQMEMQITTMYTTLSNSTNNKKHIYKEHNAHMPPKPDSAQNCVYCNKELKNIQELLERRNLQNANKNM